MNFAPSLPKDFPARDRVLAVFKRVSDSRVGEAVRAGILGSEIGEDAVLAAAARQVDRMDESTAPERRLEFLAAVVSALDIAISR